jgi:hypothetical protein
MPRAAKAGAVGAAGNRTDRPSALPASAVPSKQYGQRAEELSMQKQVPMASGDLAPGGAPPEGGAPGGPAPGELPPIDGPTNRPDEPVTNGLPSGPGAGPEALTPPDPRATGAAVLNSLGENIDPDTRQIRDILNASMQNVSRAE